MSFDAQIIHSSQKAEYHAKRRFNAVNGVRGQYLHMSGKGVTRSVMAAWVGTRGQFDALLAQNALTGFRLQRVEVV